MAIKDNTTGKGGNRGYTMVRSKFVKGKDSYGKVITLARELLIKKNGGKDPGKDVVAAHKEFGAHHSKDPSEQKAEWQTREWNSSQMGRNRDGISALDKIKLKQAEREKPKAKSKTVSEKLNDKRRRA